MIAHTLYSGYLAKFFSETFESTDLSSQNALKSLRASPLQALPVRTLAQCPAFNIWSHCLWMLEYNVRSASIIGYVGAGGIGLHLKLYAESADSWNKFSLVLLCILVIVTVSILPVKKSGNPFAISWRAPLNKLTSSFF